MTDFRAKLDSIIEEFLSGRTPFDEFQRTYSACYIDEEADKEFSPEEIDHYGVVHEKAEMTSTVLTQEERRYGWVTPPEFRTWLKVHESIKPSGP